MDSQKITQTFNGTAEWGVAGGYFKLMGTVNSVNVRLFKAGRLVHAADAVDAGHYQHADFDRVQITTGANEAVSFLYAPAEGGSDRFTGSFTPLATPPGSAHTPAKKTLGAASAQILAANANRKYLAIQNPSAAANLYVHTNGGPAAADATCFKIGPGQTWEPTVAPTGAVFGWSDTAATDYHVIEA